MTGKNDSLEGKEEKKVRRPPVAKISKEEAEKAIAEYLAKHYFLVLGTCENNIPHCTTLAYASSGTTIYIFTGNTQAVKNIRINPIVNLGIYTEVPYHPVQGVNYRGRAEIILQDNPEFIVGWKAFCNNPTLRKEEPWANMEYLRRISPGALLIKIVPYEIVLHDHSRKDYPVVVWSKK